jgi:CheY-like chemotaxis protein
MSRILLVDDDSQVNEVIKASVEILGHDVETVENGEKAIDVVAGFNPDFTLIDMMMPGKSGAEVIQDIRRINPSIITCLTTGLAEPNILEQALNAGAWALLCKPYNLSDLAELIKTAELLSLALKSESDYQYQNNSSFTFRHQGNEPVSSEDVSCIVEFARAHQASNEIANRKLPIAALELLQNAQIHGAKKVMDGFYGATITDLGETLELKVFDNGAGFDWEKTLIKARVSNDRSRASGLHMVSLLANEFCFDANGQTAFARFRKE